MGQYGKILKVVVNKEKPFNLRGSSGPTYSAYVTYSNEKEASLAILVNSFIAGGGWLRSHGQRDQDLLWHHKVLHFLRP